MTDSEQARLYANYRGDKYQRSREAFEPWYTAQFNESLDSKEALGYRRSLISVVFRDTISDQTIGKVLDFGGHRGELIAGLVGDAEAFVYDVSGVSPISGVSTLSTPEACKIHDVDLIVCSNVIEHVAEPLQTLAEIERASGKSTIVYVEVPEELPLGFWSIVKRIVQLGILAIRRTNVALALLRPEALFQMHEHVNCFSPQSLEKLLQEGGWEMKTSGTYDVAGVRVGPFRIAGNRMLWAFAKPPLG